MTHAATLIQAAEALSAECSDLLRAKDALDRACAAMVLVLVAEALGAAHTLRAAERAVEMATGTEMQHHAEARLASRTDEANKTLDFARRSVRALLA